MQPWVLGFTKRVENATAGAPAFAERERSILINFGASHPYPHGTRERAQATFEPLIGQLLPIDRTKDDLNTQPTDPYDLVMWEQTGGRFSRSYYERLKRSQAVACFCGELIPPSPFRNPERYLVGGNRAKLRRAFYDFLGKLDPRPERSVQWDSFRFWEAVTAGCATFNLDLDRYGALLPVMPENWKHYIGLNLDDVRPALQRLQDEPELLGRIAAAGATWAFEHYSPRRMAERFLQTLGMPLEAGASAARP
jgi:hypothetical protein